MILRRVIDHFRKQEWTAIALDFVIVVTGVFIGIQVANWNEERNDRSNESLYLSYLAEDLQSDIVEFDYVRSVTEWRISALAAVITAATGEPMPTSRATPRGQILISKAPLYKPEDPSSVVMAMSLLVTFDSSDLTYNTMVNTGSIRLLRNQDLARRWQEYHAAVRDLQRIESRLTPYRDDLTRILQLAGVAWTDTYSVEELAEIARNNPELLAAMKNFWAFNDWHVRSLDTIRTIATDLKLSAHDGSNK